MFIRNQIASFFQNYPFPSLLLDTDSSFTITDLNQAYISQFLPNNGDGTLIGKSIDYLLTDEGQPFKGALNDVLTSKEGVASVPISLKTKAIFSISHLSSVLTPILTETGEVKYILCSLHPDSKRKPDDTSSNGSSSPLLHKLQERIKEQTCLHHISNLNEQKLSADELLKQALQILLKGWQYVSQAAIEYNGTRFTTPGYKDTLSILSAENEIKPGIKLTIKVAYSNEHPLHEESGFLKEERLLINSVLNHLSLKLDQVQTQKELKEKQELLDKAYQLARIGTWEFDMQTHDLHWSPVTKEVHGFDHNYEPNLEDTINLFKEGHHRDTFTKAAYDAIEREKPFDVELKIVSGQGDERWIRATGEPEYKDGICTRFYGISQNVTDRRKAEEDLILSERRFRSLVQDGSDLMAILDSKANYIYVSPTSESILGIPAGNFIGTNAFDYVHPDDKLRLAEVLGDLEPGRQNYIEPFRYRDSKNNWRWIETTLTDLSHDPAVGGLVANSRDVTEHKHQQEKILEALKEKETLLSEIHHRVKNNLAVISGMLQLQITDDEDTALTDKLGDSIIRIKTMANIHEQLYQSKSFSKLQFTENIQLLIKNIQQTLQTDTNVDIACNCDPIHLNINQAIPCSLIINEVVTNIFKHAFPNMDKGTISLILSETEHSGWIQLSISDNGVGLPSDFDMAESDSLGMSLIDVLSHQLEATYRYTATDKGTTFSLRFKKDDLRGVGNNLL